MHVRIECTCLFRKYESCTRSFRVFHATKRACSVWTWTPVIFSYGLFAGNFYLHFSEFWSWMATTKTLDDHDRHVLKDVVGRLKYSTLLRRHSTMWFCTRYHFRRIQHSRTLLPRLNVNTFFIVFKLFVYELFSFFY